MDSFFGCELVFGLKKKAVYFSGPSSTKAPVSLIRCKFSELIDIHVVVFLDSSQYRFQQFDRFLHGNK